MSIELIVLCQWLAMAIAFGVGFSAGKKSRRRIDRYVLKNTRTNDIVFEIDATDPQEAVFHWMVHHGPNREGDPMVLQCFEKVAP